MSRRSERSRSYTNAPENASGGSEREEGIGDIEDEEEITRCICGRDEINSSSINPQLEDLLQKQYDISIDPGLFIQCDKCSVWQHGYCVGLFINEDVPEKYWCELCKPELHILIHETDGDERSLYKPVNEKRKKLLSEHMQYDANGKYSSRQRNRRIGGQLSDKENKVVRKERRHYNDVYNEQLQKALRESAKESGLPLEDDGKRSNRKRVKNDDGDGDGDGDDDGNGVYGGENSKFEEESETFLDEKSKMVHNDTQDVSNDEGENVTRASEEADSSSLDSKRQKLTSKPSKSKPTYKKQGSKPSKINDKPTVSPLSKDELISQKLKPRYVSDKSSIYELRRRTGAILEWLGRTQLELEDERVNKIEIFDYKENPNEGLASSDEQNRSVIFSFSENLQAMEKLTEQILRWEQKFGKYAP